jgi:hypothetical protein
VTTIALTATQIAADGQSTSSYGCITGRCFKKITVEKAAVYAVSGQAALMAPLIAWHMSGARPEAVPKHAADVVWSLLVVPKNGSPSLYTSQAPYPESIELPFAIGIGAEIAIGAMEHGASAREAVMIAMRRNVHTGGDIQVVDIAKALGLSQPGDVPAQTYLPNPDKPGKFVVRQPKRERAV